MGRFNDQLWQVAMTYLTRRSIVVAVGLAFLLLSLMLFAALVGPFADKDVPKVIAVLPCAVAGFIVIQAKAQFAHPRAALLPNFARPHLLVLMILLAVLLVAWPILVSGGVGVQAVNVAALSIAVAATSIWGMQRNNGLQIVSVAIFLSGIFPWEGNWWFKSGHVYQACHVVILLAGWAAIVAWLWRLAGLREEADDYQQVFNLVRGAKSGGESSERRRLIARTMGRLRWLAWLGDRWHARLPNLRSEERFRPPQLLQYGFGAAPPVFSAVMGAVIMIGVTAAWLAGFRAFAGNQGSDGFSNGNGMWFYLLIYTALPGTIAGQTLAERRPRIAAEALFPLTRSQLIDGLLLALARNTLVYWLAMNIGLLLVARWMLGSQFTLAAACVYVLLSMSLCLAGFGAGIRSALWDSLMERLVAAGIGGCIGMGALALWWSLRSSVGDGPFIGMALAIAAIGAWLTQRGRQAWLNFELG